MTATIPDGGALSVNLVRRLMKLATSTAGKWVEAKNVSRSRKNLDRCFE
jgi:hypothetical protein